MHGTMSPTPMFVGENHPALPEFRTTSLEFLPGELDAPETSGIMAIQWPEELEVHAMTGKCNREGKFAGSGDEYG